jgi:hypothetical protein
MKQTYSFYKEDNGDWFIDLPLDGTFTKADYQMVCGADIMLDIISNFGNLIKLEIDTEQFDGSDVLQFVAEPEYGGAEYRVDNLDGKYIGTIIWLCNVTKYLFGSFPLEIYLKKV